MRFVFVRDPDSAVAPTEWSPKLSVSTEGAPQARPIGACAQTLAHPVFFKSREPFVAPPPALPPAIPKSPPAPVSTDPGLALAGVMIGEGQRKAYLVSKAAAHGSWISEGESLSGWTIESVSAAGVKLQHEDRGIAALSAAVIAR